MSDKKRLLSLSGEDNELLPLVVCFVFILSILLAALSVFTIYTPEEVVAATDNDLWTTYENSDYGIEIQYHKNWNYQEFILDESTLDFVFVTFESPPNPTHKYIPTIQVGIDVKSLSGQSVAMTPEKYAQGLIRNLNQTLVEFQLVENTTNYRNTTLDGRPAYKFIYTDRLPERDATFKTMEIGTIVDNKVYFIIYNVEEGHYSKHWPAAKKMLDSFRIDEHAQPIDTSPVTDLTEDYNFSQYEDPTSRLTLLYPSNWTKQEGNVMDFRSVLGTTYNSSVYFYTPLEGRLDQFQETLLVQVENLPPSNDLTLEEYANETIPVLREGTAYFNLVNSTPITISEIPAHVLAYEYTIEGDNYRGIDIMSIIDRKVYYFSFQTERSKYTAYLPELQKIFESLRFMTDRISDDYRA